MNNESLGAVPQGAPPEGDKPQSGGGMQGGQGSPVSQGMPFAQEDVDRFYTENQPMVDFIVGAVIENHPDIQAAREQLKTQRDHDCLNAAMEEFLAEFPDEGIKAPEDFMQLENADMFIKLIERGLNFNDAYKLLSYEKQNKRGRGLDPSLKKATKGHIKTSGGFDKGSDKPIPSEVLEMYKSLCKGWSEEKIKKHYLGSKQ